MIPKLQVDWDFFLCLPFVSSFISFPLPLFAFVWQEMRNKNEMRLLSFEPASGMESQWNCESWGSGRGLCQEEGNIGWQRLWKQDARLLYDFESRECTLIDQTTKVIGQLCFSKFRLEFALWVRQRRCPCLFFLSISFVFPSSSNLICFVDCEEERHRRQFDWSNISSIELFFSFLFLVFKRTHDEKCSSKADAHFVLNIVRYFCERASSILFLISFPGKKRKNRREVKNSRWEVKRVTDEKEREGCMRHPLLFSCKRLQIFVEKNHSQALLIP